MSLILTNNNSNILRLCLDLIAFEHMQLLKNVILFTPSESFHLTPQQVCTELPSLARVENSRILILQEAVQTKKAQPKGNTLVNSEKNPLAQRSMCSRHRCHIGINAWERSEG